MKYRSDIDGLRALAVLIVVFFHLDWQLFSGGFVGVDAFFVISGFLITSIIENKLNLNAFSLREFYLRRIRRILPAMFVMLWLTLGCGWFFLLPSDYALLGKGAAATAVYLSNVFLWRQTGYFDESSHYNPLLHTWSLSVEEQFYLVFPWVMIFLSKFWGTKSRKKALGLVVLGSLSLFWSMYLLRHKPDASYYLASSRAFEFLCGCILALSGVELRGRLAGVGGWAGFLGLLFCSVVYTPATAFPGLAALLPSLATALILASAKNSPSLAKLFSASPAVFFGKISYSLYLWHWPVIIYYKQYNLVDLTLLQEITAFCISVLLAVLSWRFVEQPVRSLSSQRYVKATFSVTAALTLATAALGLWTAKKQGFPQRLAGQPSFAYSTWEFPDHCDNFQASPKTYEQIKACPVGTEPAEILFWGDSHIEQLYPLVQANSAFSTQKGSLFMTSGGCPPALSVNRAAGGFDCAGFSRAVLSFIQQSSVKRVVIGMSTKYFYDDAAALVDMNGRRVSMAQVAQDLQKVIKRLLEMEKEVFVVYSFPRFALNVPRFFKLSQFWQKTQEVDHLKPLTSGEFDKHLDEQLSALNISRIYPRKLLCRDGLCRVSDGEKILYFDSEHLNSVGTTYLQSGFDGVFKN